MSASTVLKWRDLRQLGFSTPAFSLPERRAVKNPSYCIWDSVSVWGVGGPPHSPCPHGARPYKMSRVHGAAVRAVARHLRHHHRAGNARGAATAASTAHTAHAHALRVLANTPAARQFATALVTAAGVGGGCCLATVTLCDAHKQPSLAVITPSPSSLTDALRRLLSQLSDDKAPKHEKGERGDNRDGEAEVALVATVPATDAAADALSGGGGAAVGELETAAPVLSGSGLMLELAREHWVEP